MHFRIVAPSACVDADKIELAQTYLESLGHQVSLSEHIFKQYRYLAGTVEQRIHDLKQACSDPNVDIIWCGRGGTGAAQLLPYLDDWILNKPILGYSDSTALLNEVAMRGGTALHAPVFQEIAVKNLDSSPLSHDALKSIGLFSADVKQQHYAITSANRTALHQTELIQQMVLGGNLTVLCSLQGTAHHLALKQPSILLLEDVGEPYYRLERAFTQLLQSIDVSLLSAVVLGDFYQCPQKNVPHSLIEIFNEYLEPLNIPLYQCSWFGHGEQNRPFWIGKTANIIQSQLII